MKEELHNLCKEFAEAITEQMDISTLATFAEETIVDNLEDMSEPEILEHISQFYPEMVEEYRE